MEALTEAADLLADPSNIRFLKSLDPFNVDQWIEEIHLRTTPTKPRLGCYACDAMKRLILFIRGEAHL